MKYLFFFIFILFGNETGFSQNIEFEFNYDNGNGTILNQFYDSGNRITVRKHEQRFSVYPSSMRPYDINEIVAYENYDKNSRQLFKLKNGDYINTLQVANIKKSATGVDENWVKIMDDNNRIGWLDMDDQWDRYSDGIWSIIEKFTINGRNWTVRKLGGGVSVYETLNVRNKPGTIGTTVLFQLIPIRQNHTPVSVTILAITEEKDSIDDKTDHWLYIKDEQNRIGWIFGGYTTVDRGGPKLRTPNNQISFNFNLP
jgi:hypothetical protein